MKRLFWLIAMLIITVPVAAQDRDKSTSDTLPGTMPVHDVFLTRTEDNALSLTIFGTPVTCTPVVVEQSRHTYTMHSETGENLGEGTLINVQLTTDPAREGEVCNFIAPFSQTVELEGTFETDQNYVLTINDFTAWIYLIRPGQLIADMELQQVDLGETELVGWLNSAPTIDSVTWGASAERHVINIEGTLPDGCPGSVMSYIAQDNLNTELQHVNVFRLLPLAVMCPAAPVEFNAMIETDMMQSTAVTFEVGGRLYQTQPAADVFTPQVVIQRPIVVDAVTITGTDGNYQVQVSGTQSGDCGAQLQEVSGTNGAVSVIEIFDLVPELAACTKNIIFYENTFMVSQMPVVVNGVVYFADDARSNLPEQGSMMQVDTVVENVEVLVLESFPMQLNLVVTGYQPDGCSFPVQIDQTRVDDTVTVHIYREMPQDSICPMMIVGYEETIALEGGFEGGTITIHVNEQTVTVEL